MYNNLTIKITLLHCSIMTATSAPFQVSLLFKFLVALLGELSRVGVTEHATMLYVVCYILVSISVYRFPQW